MGKPNVSEKSTAKENIIEMKRKQEKANKVKKLRKKFIILALFIIVVVGFISLKSKAQGKAVFNYEEVTAEYGDINITVDGKGVIQPLTQCDIYASVTGEILGDNVEVGKKVNKGDILYEIDSDDINISLSRAELLVKQSELTYNNTKRQVSDLNIVATGSGIVQGLTIKKGSYVNNSMEICQIKESDKYKIKLQYTKSVADNINVGDLVYIELIDYLTNVNGYVTEIEDKNVLLSNGSQVTQVTIQVDSMNYSIEGARAIGHVYLQNGETFKSTNVGTFTYIDTNIVRAKSFGTVEEVYVSEGSFVNCGDIIAVLSSTDLNNSLNSASIALSDARLSYANAQKQLDNYVITSPISGTIVYKNSKLGDNLSKYSVSNSNVMATIADTSIMKFDMEVDELDIAEVKVGQEVIITIEALNNKEYIGTVANINTIGKNIGGITTYTVTIELEGDEEIYSGMNVDADIQVSSVKNVVKVPLETVRRGNFVYIKTNDYTYQDEDINVPMGYKKVLVEIGKNDDEYIEIVSGINEGDILLIDKVTQSGVLNMRTMMSSMREE